MNMSSKMVAEDAPEAQAATLTIRPDTVCWLIVKFREFDAKDAPTEPDPGSNASDDRMVSVLEDRPDDPVVEELSAIISALSEDEQIDLVALMWLGRDDNTLDDWPAIRAEAARARAEHQGGTARYLLGEPMASDYFEEGLSLFGLTCDRLDIE
jgi:hypothetical protein